MERVTLNDMRRMEGSTGKYLHGSILLFYPCNMKHTINIYVLYSISVGVASFRTQTRLFAVCASLDLVLPLGDSLWQWWWEYAPLLLSSVIICDRLYGQARLVTQPHTGLLSVIWLISILYNALLPTATVNERIVTRSLSRVNQRQDREGTSLSAAQVGQTNVGVFWSVSRWCKILNRYV